MSEAFEALFGDGSPLIHDGERWTFTPAVGLPVEAGEGLLTYLNRLAANCLIIKGVWSSQSYLKNQAVAHANQMWVATETTTAYEEPGQAPVWVPLFHSLKGLQGEPGRDGFNTVAEAI